MEEAKIISGSERRHGARINSEFWVCVKGRDTQPHCVSGDISVSGIFLYIDKSIGAAGSIHEMEISTYDQGETVAVMSLVVREVTVTDMYRGDLVVGVVMGFLFQDPEQRHDVEQFVFQVAMLQGDRPGDMEIQHSFDATVDNDNGGPGQKEAVVRSLAPDRMVMETDWPLKVGETIQVEVRLPASNKVVGFSGKVRSSNMTSRDDGSIFYEVHVSFEEISHDTDQYSAAAVRHAIARSEDDNPSFPKETTASAEPFRSMLGEATQAPKEESALISVYHLCGTLAQRGLSSLLGFLDLERRSGVVSLTIRRRKIQLFIRNGRLIDVERDGRTTDPHALLPGLMELDQGEFEIAFRPVKRKDRLGVSTTALLLELAQRSDEK